MLIEVVASLSPGADDSKCTKCGLQLPSNNEIMMDPILTAVEVGVAGGGVVVDRKSVTEFSR